MLRASLFTMALACLVSTHAAGEELIRSAASGTWSNPATWGAR